MKTHIFTTTTGAMKNAFGGLLNERRHWTHPVIHETLVDLLMIQKKIHRGVFAVMDGTFAGDGPGPRCMVPHVKNVILASADQVAIDAVAAKLMGIDPMSITFIRLAHDLGLGCGDPRDIEIVGDVEAAERELELRRALQEDDVRLADAAQDLLGPAQGADRVVAQDGARAVGVHGERGLPRQLLVPVQRQAQMQQALDSDWGRLFRNWETLTPDQRGFPRSGDRRPNCSVWGLKAFYKSLGILGTCVKEAPEFIQPQAQGRHPLRTPSPILPPMYALALIRYRRPHRRRCVAHHDAHRTYLLELKARGVGCSALWPSLDRARSASELRRRRSAGRRPAASGREPPRRQAV